MELEHKLSRAMGKAMGDFRMLDTLLFLLREWKKLAPVRFDIKVVNIDQGHPGYPADVLVKFMERERYDFTLIKEDTYSIVTEKIPEGKTYCSLCSRLRRGILYRVADELGCTKIALGHHREDILVTFLLNLQFAGKLAAMPPKLMSDDGKHVVIRPLAYCAEEDIGRLAQQKGFPILPCDLCGSQENLQRKIVGKMLEDMERERPGTKTIMLTALGNVVPRKTEEPAKHKLRLVR
jgi:tRNA 2-thiocytidine biosynthesis protein TtcA